MFSAAQKFEQSAMSHFDLTDDASYQKWRSAKLAAYPVKVNQIIVPVEKYFSLTQAEKDSILHNCRLYNFSLYRLPENVPHSGRVPLKIAKQLGLQVSDKHLCTDRVGLSEITVTEKKAPGEYIPYTNKPINWHTDGYYNEHNKQIHSMILHCAQPAKAGGENSLFDHDVLYILLRDENPDYIDVLMQDDVMTIPENVQSGQLIRQAQTGPVFRLFPWGLHMRYTARTHSIYWKKDLLVKKAVDRIFELLSTNSIYKVDYRFSQGEGMISHNVLHRRNGFQDFNMRAKQRMMYRVRFYQRLITD